MLKKVLLLTSTIFLSNNLFADNINKSYDSPVYDFDSKQLSNFELAYKYGKAIGYPKIMMGIMNTESAAINEPVGDVVNAPFKRSYGIMQVKLGTYYWMKGTGYLYGENLLEEEILHKLMYNKSFNVYSATSYYKYLVDKCGNVKSAIIAYNTGLCSPEKNTEAFNKGNDYLAKVTKFVNFAENYAFDEYIRKRVETSYKTE